MITFVKNRCNTQVDEGYMNESRSHLNKRNLEDMKL